jgi:AsmA protein
MYGRPAWVPPAGAEELFEAHMTYTRPPGKGSPQVPRRDSLGADRHAGAARGYDVDPQRPLPRGSSLLSSILFYGGVLLLAFAVGAGTFFIMSPPTDLIRREIIARVKAETGRDLRIAGGASFTIFPLGLRLGDISLSAPASMGGEPLLKAASLDVGVDMLPLLRQEIVVDRLVLNEPVFSLRVDSEGRRSWDMAGAALPLRFARADGAWPRLGGFITEAAAAPRRADDISLENIEITDGAVRYADDRSGAWARFDGLNASFSVPSLGEPLTGSGTVVAEGETFAFKSTLASPADLIDERPAKLSLTVTGKPISFSYDGTVGPYDGQGMLSATSPSLGALAAWWGTPVSAEQGAGAVAFTARLNASQKSVHLSDIDLKAGPATASGSVAFSEREGLRPHVTAELKISGLDVAALPLGADLRAGRGGGSAVPAPTPLSLPGAEPAPQEGEPSSIEDLLDRPAGPQVKGYTQRSGWSTEPIDVRALALADVDARVVLAGVKYGPTRIDGAEVGLAVKDEVARVTVEDLRLYEGSGRGLITLDASAGAAPSLTSDVSLTGIAAGPLLRDSAHIDWITGNADVAWKVSGRGATEADIVASLSGTSRVSLHDGAVVGFDLGGAMRELGEGNIPSLENDPAKKTDFRSLTGTFAIANGIATNNDLKLDSEHLQASGDGTVDLPQRSLDYTVRPKLIANLGGEGSAENAAAIEVPVHLTGSWEEPQLAPDLEGALNSQTNLDAVKQLGKRLQGKGAGEIVEDLFGKGKDGGPSKAEKLLEGLFGGKE